MKEQMTATEAVALFNRMRKEDREQRAKAAAEAKERRINRAEERIGAGIRRIIHVCYDEVDGATMTGVVLDPTPATDAEVLDALDEAHLICSSSLYNGPGQHFCNAPFVRRGSRRVLVTQFSGIDC